MSFCSLEARWLLRIVPVREAGTGVELERPSKRLRVQGMAKRHQTL